MKFTTFNSFLALLSVCSSVSILALPLEPRALDFEMCQRPTCSVPNIGTYWPSKISPMLYYRCMPNMHQQWTPRFLFCLEDTFFSFTHQMCVPFEEWTDACPVEGGGSSSTEGTPQSSSITPESTVSTASNPSTATESSRSSQSTEDISSSTNKPETISTSDDVGITTKDSTEIVTEEEITDPASSSTDTSTESHSSSSSELTASSESSSEQTTESSTLQSWVPTEESTPTTPLPPGFELCEEPICRPHTADTFWPHQSPTIYFRCITIAGGNYIWRMYWCPPDRLFSFTHQRCVSPDLWEESCAQVEQNKRK